MIGLPPNPDGSGDLDSRVDRGVLTRSQRNFATARVARHEARVVGRAVTTSGGGPPIRPLGRRLSTTTSTAARGRLATRHGGGNIRSDPFFDWFFGFPVRLRPGQPL